MGTVTETKRYPLDFDALDTGSVIDENTLNHIFTFKYAEQPEKWKLKQLGLSGVIKSKLAEQGKNVRVKCRKRHIEVLRDLAASYDAARARNQKLRSAIHDQMDVLQVNASEFDDTEKKRHDREILIGGNYIGALAGAHFRPALLAHKRMTPPPVMIEHKKGTDMKGLEGS